MILAMICNLIQRVIFRSKRMEKRTKRIILNSSHAVNGHVNFEDISVFMKQRRYSLTINFQVLITLLK